MSIHILTILGIIFFVTILVIQLISVKFLFRYKDFKSLRILFINTLMSFWTIIMILLNFNPHIEIVKKETIIMLARFGIISLLMAVIIFLYFLDNPVYGYDTIIMTRLSIGIFTSLAALAFADNFVERFYLYTQIGHDWKLEFHYVIYIMSLIGIITSIIALLFSSKLIQSLPAYLYTTKDVRFYLFVISFNLIALVTFGIMNFLQLSFHITSYVFLISTIGVQISILYFSYSQPFLHFGMGTNPYLLIEERLVGYFLSTVTDEGPKLKTYQEEFLARSGITELSLNLFQVSSMTFLGMDQEFDDNLVVFPFPKNNEHAVITCSFMMKNKTLKDERMNTISPTLFGIIVPSAIILGLHNFENALISAKSHLNQYSDVQELSEHTHLDRLSEIILTELLL